ncbi:GspE/PulE family protein [endosymbiont of Ridgeia piscesae]|jgi:general secretion pathway protein E|uniref:Type II secretion system protein E (GspE) n=1 Tax=endosymbiont of Ridgeia piscesae TaxID=54398 RepID=A0A0T5YYC3_9GAMM|nr:GspE/PulE family protein [endosymbiont of Ridgeia piscesae]KRT55564.1 type II secretion system protein E (GspE) [endosymbiont of Ridgeia piscesae]KRT57768.1 type II secretion system protein E (GspE) [endosymbiont of Ridgeia piscesae]
MTTDVSIKGQHSPSASPQQKASLLDSGIGGYLVQTGRLRREEAENALRIFSEQQSESSFAVLLVRMGMLSDQELAQAQSAFHGIPLIDESEFPERLPYGSRISLAFLNRNLCVPVQEDEAGLVVAMVDPDNPYLLEALRMVSGCEVVPRIGVVSEIEAAFRQRYTETDEEAAARGEMGRLGAVGDDDIEHLKELASEAPVIKLVNQLIQQAVNQQASDIHIEPFEQSLKVRYRIDGIMREIENAPAEVAAAVVSRVKILANLNIAERRLPQDGRFKIKVKGVWLDLRVSTVPTVYGESVVLRLLHSEGAGGDFKCLGFTREQEEKLRAALSIPHGIILVTGPTGSGKTTTLYAALNHLNTPERKILSVEDPVEYNIDGINQIQVKPQIGLTFSNALRSIVRQDPDVIMIGEMRDQETAAIAIQSALTGHLVLSTLHTNDAAGSITRLLDMGVDDFLLKSTLTVVLAQRLVRRLCDACKQPYRVGEELAQRLRLSASVEMETAQFYTAHGCEQCRGTGYVGRAAIIEIILLDDKIRDLIMARADSLSIARQARSANMLTLYEDGMAKAARGVTTIEEILRVTRLD